MAHVLVIDDDEILQDLLTFALELEGHTVAVAGDGQAALSHVAETRPDLMIVDLHMPVMDGVRFLSEVNEKLADVPPALVLSASGGASLHGRLRELGAREIVRKPIDMAAFKARVAKMLDAQTAY